MPKIQALSPILYEKLREKGEIFEVSEDVAARLVDNGAAVIYVEPEIPPQEASEAPPLPPSLEGTGEAGPA